MEGNVLPETSESGSLGGYIYNDDEDDDADDELDNEHSDFESCEELEGANQRAAREISDLSISGISAVQHDETLPHEDASDDYVEIVKNLSDSEQSSDDDVSEPLKLRKFDYTLVLECMCAGSKRKQINVWLPETLVFVNNVPLCWYFTRKQDCTISKRNFGHKKSMTNQQILAKFGGLTGEITSYFVHVTDVDEEHMSWKIEYFDRKSLRDFLYDENATRNGFLQKFVCIRKHRFAASLDTNQLLQTFDVRWKKDDLRSTRVQTRSYVFRIPDDGTSSYRYGMAEPHDHRSSHLSMNSTITKKAQSVCRCIAESMKLPVDGYSRTLQRIHCKFRMGKEGVLWFQFCTWMRADKYGPLQRRLSSLRMSDLLFSSSRNLLQGEPAPDSSLAQQSKGPVQEHEHVRSVEAEQVNKVSLPTKSQDMRTCSLCSARILAQTSCSVTYGEVLPFLMHLNVSLRSQLSPADAHQGEAAAEAAVENLPQELWREMQLKEEEEVGLQDLSCRLQLIGLSPSWIERIIVEMASSDEEISGFVDLRLFRMAIEASQGQRGRGWTDGGEERREWEHGDSIFSDQPLIYQYMSPTLHKRKVPSVFNELALHIPELDFHLLFEERHGGLSWAGVLHKDVVCCLHCKRVCKLFVEAKLRGLEYSEPQLDKLKKLVHPNSPTLLAIMWNLRGKKTSTQIPVDREWSLDRAKESRKVEQQRGGQHAEQVEAEPAVAARDL
ncbi:hypothetical protein GUITHDRAFT_163688 [Guillardia theta CCMP2712]|uniref:Uncharacterized protein n=1 Tax=Guillardia theta (strain CCMP2712) TaxID=905079 RepID=L1J772_GUITC|nr:hypothetical protein GUITHDRAFT_163688 [Guillardia theta CCMP2712]EKX43949.1 hypothetical protein GUITHDRAFT_163688 [Guillardia theta CCMP2712]|eukprot:XP_005830929.1 hypothetical protein GUITHDRAFT_163688 [Guillardia theta CCMP2712]